MITDLYELVKAIGNNKNTDPTSNLAAKITREVDTESGRLDVFSDSKADKDTLVESLILDMFNQLPSSEKIKILKEAFVSKKKLIKYLNTNNEQSFETTENVKLRTWLVKYIVIFLMSCSLVFMGLIFYISTIKLSSPEPSVLGAILETAADVLKLLFLPLK